MKRYLLNTGYFIRESFTVIRLSPGSNFLSFLSIGLAFFLLALVMAAGWISVQVVDLLQDEAEISAFFSEEVTSHEIEELTQTIREMEGVTGARIVSEEEAYQRMAAILGEEAGVLGLFDESPFESFMEIGVDLEASSSLYGELEEFREIRHIRDNRDTLDQIRNLSLILRFLGALFVTAAGAATLVIISHIIRQGIYQNKDQINTLRLLGAPEGFIGIPFVISGLGLTLTGGLMAIVLSGFSIHQLYARMAAPIPFLPLPDRQLLLFYTAVTLLGLSLVLGLAGSLMGLKTSRGD